MARRKTYEELTFCDDFMFCKILEDDPALCKSLLEAILEQQIDGFVRVKKQETVGHDAFSHGVRFDVYVTDGQGAVYDVEMQQANGRRELPKRSRYLQSMMDLDLLLPGENYRNLKKSYVIFICRFNLFPEAGLYKYSFRNVCREAPDIVLGDEAEKIFLCTKGKENSMPPGLKGLLRYLEQQPASDALTENIDAAVRKARNLGRWRREYMTLEEKLQDAREEGREEGRLEGREEERANTLRERERAEAAEMLLSQYKEKFGELT